MTTERMSQHRAATSTTSEQATRVAQGLINFLETGTPLPELFADDVFCDFTSPRWRLQARGRDQVVALRRHSHPSPGVVSRFRCDPIPSGFVIEWEERWTDEQDDWYCREMARVELEEGAISALSVYCTGDWDTAQRVRHAREVRLLRP
jgi:hypothetical protein